MEKEKRVKIDDRFGKEFEGSYVFKTISWGESNRISGECTQINPLTRKTSIDLKRLQAMMVDATLAERPKAVTLKILLGEDKDIILPPILGELLLTLTDFVNGYSEEDREAVKNLKRQWGLE